MKILIWLIAIGGLLCATFFFLTRKFTGYKVLEDKVIYQFINGSTWKKIHRELENADPESFKIFGFSGVYAKDKNQVYLEGRLIPEADPKSFKILEGLYKYAKDKNYLFCSTNKIGNIADGYEYLGKGFAKNDIHAFNQGRLIKGADGKTFTLMDEEGLYARDHQSVYCFGKKVEGVHSASFRHLKFLYYSDKNSVYYLSYKLENSNPSEFEFFGDRYSKSGNTIYYRENIIEGADAASFEVISGKDSRYLAQDKNHKYIGAQKVKQFPNRSS